MKIRNFTKTIEMEKATLAFKDRMTASQFNFICSMRKKQIGRVKMNYEEMKKYLTKADAMKLIGYLREEYYDINVVLKKKFVPKQVEVIPDDRPNNLPMTLTRLDMFETKLRTLKK